MARILAYADRLSVAPGERIKMMVSCDGIKSYDATLVRVIQGDINPEGPGFKEERIEVDLHRFSVATRRYRAWRVRSHSRAH